MSLFAAVHFIHSNGDFTTGFCVLELLRKLCVPQYQCISISVSFSTITSLKPVVYMFYLRWVMWLHCTRQVTAVAQQQQLSSYFNRTFEQSGSSQYAVLLIFRNGASSLPRCSRLSMLCVFNFCDSPTFSFQQVVHVVCSIWIRRRRLLCLRCRGSSLGVQFFCVFNF